MMTVILQKAGREFAKRYAINYLVLRGVSATLEDVAAYRAARRAKRQKEIAEAFASAVSSQAEIAIRRSLLPEDEEADEAFESLRNKLRREEE